MQFNKAIASVCGLGCVSPVDEMCEDSVHLIFLTHISIYKIFRQVASDPCPAPDNNKVSCAAEAE